MRPNHKLNSALKLLESTGMMKSNYAPPIHKFLWGIGIQIPPPHFCSFTFNFLYMGISAGVLWGLFMWIVFWLGENEPIVNVPTLAATCGILFGFFMSLYYSYGARKYSIPKWQNFKPE